jgi:protein O-GlcNAc transferase
MSDMSAALAETLQLHQAGNLNRAEQGYRRILRHDPFHAEALHLLGLVSHQRGNSRDAVGFFNRAIAVDGRKAEFHANLGNAYASLGQSDEALECYQQAVHLAPKLAPAHLSLGMALLERGDLLGADAHLQQAIRLAPALGAAQFQMGNLRLAQQNPRDALGCFFKALELDPHNVEALNNLGIVLATLGETDKALAAYQLAVKLRPGFDRAWNNLGALYELLGRLDLAEQALRQSLRVAPQNAGALNNLGAILQSRDDAEGAEACFRQALAIEPESADAAGNLAGVLQLQGRLDEACDCYGRAMNLRNDPRLAIQAALMLPPVYDSADQLRESRERLIVNLGQLADRQIAIDPAREPVPVNFLLAYQGENDREIQEQFARLCIPARHRDALPLLPRRRPDGKIRIGFVSKFLRDHTIGDLMRGVIARLSRREFHVTVLSVGAAHDETALAIGRSADATGVLPAQIPAARERIAELGFDVLLYPDLGLDPFCTTLAWSRLAPVQCTTWGHPVTTGIPTVDYYISSDLLETADAERHYSERLVRLSTLPAYYERPQPAGPSMSRADFGLSSDAHVYLCPQSLFKFHPDFDAVLAEILERDPQGRLVVVQAPHRHWNELLVRRWQRTLGELLARVQFVPRLDRRQFLHLLSVADVILDPLHFGGGNTSFQALGLGVPVVTLPSPYLRGRVTAGCYRQMGVTSCIATTGLEYIEQAVRLGTDREYNAAVRAEIAANSASLFENDRTICEFEDFLRQSVSQTRPSFGRVA